MANDKTKTYFRDRELLSGEDGYEVASFAREFQLTIPEVRELIRKHGNDRATLQREAMSLGV
jgi:Mor family transcriptional regulator